MTYAECVKQVLNKSIRDEISSAIFYVRAAKELYGTESQEVAEELEDHAMEEFEHFVRLLHFANMYGLEKDIEFTLDERVVNLPIKNVNQVIDEVQKLEVIAIEDYKKIVNRAKEVGDVPVEEFFNKLVQEEVEHFDDLAFVNNDKRSLEESPRTELHKRKYLRAKKMDMI